MTNNLDKLDSIYNVEDEYIDNEFKFYLNTFQKNVNSFKNIFQTFSQKYNLLPKINTNYIIMNNFSLPLFKNIPIYFNLDYL